MVVATARSVRRDSNFTPDCVKQFSQQFVRLSCASVDISSHICQNSIAFKPILSLLFPSLGLMTMAFQYQPLDASSQEIRLVTLAPRLPLDGSDGRIQCRLNTLSLASKPKFEALSSLGGRIRTEEKYFLRESRLWCLRTFGRP
jgi:hypothetical protein